MTACRALTGQKNNVTPGDKSGPGKSTCRRRERWESRGAKHCPSAAHVCGITWFLLFSVYVSTRIHTPFIATTTSAVTRKVKVHDHSLGHISEGSCEIVNDWTYTWHTGRPSTSQVGWCLWDKRSLLMRNWKCVCLGKQGIEKWELAFKNEEGCVWEIIEPMFSTASCLKHTHIH